MKKIIVMSGILLLAIYLLSCAPSSRTGAETTAETVEEPSLDEEIGTLNELNDLDTELDDLNFEELEDLQLE